VTTDTRLGPTVKDYNAAFAAERVVEYPTVDAFETRMGYAVDRLKLEEAARVLACPLKVHAPNWQHGRILYAAARRYLAVTDTSVVTMLDVGTAKGFSALCLAWALQDSGVDGRVITVDVIDPTARIFRNTVADLHGLKTLAELLVPWPEAAGIEALKIPGVRWLQGHPERVHFAFVDGKHSGSVVKQEGQLLAARQTVGDIVVFDDVHLPDVWNAVHGLEDYYTERIEVLPSRAYGLAVRL
jgi:predicted O-methyltransferase YrrM